MASPDETSFMASLAQNHKEIQPIFDRLLTIEKATKGPSDRVPVGEILISQLAVKLTQMHTDANNLLELNETRILAAQRQAGFLTIFLILVAILLNSAISLHFSNKISKSIGMLRHGAQLMTQGKLDYKFEVKGRDEIGQLASAFNEMADRSQVFYSERQSAYNELQNAHDELERRVEERTTELKRLNALLEKDVNELKRMEEALRESEERYRRLVELSPEAIAVHTEGKYTYVNPAGAKLLGAANPEELIGISIMDIIHPDYREIVQARIKGKIHVGAVAPLMEQKLIRLDGQVIDVEVTGMSVEYLGQKSVQIVIRDVTARKRAEMERERFTSELQEALAKVKLLSGFLPICASCKKIRDDRGYWRQIESYIRDHSEADFSHGICPDCARKLYPELYDEN
ncbi:MAG: PAS domain S-box protein [Deltaproteobacteria bacterium]|nr:PAS domain S-box protein [Deltaproteobacteria bacterium]